MSTFLRYLLAGAAIVIIAIWIFMVLRSCQDLNNTTDKAINRSPSELVEPPADTTSEDPGDIDYTDAVTSDKTGADLDAEEVPAEKQTTEMESTDDSRLTDETAGTDDSPYLVIAGTYTSEGNAQSEVNRLNGLGYSDAEVVQFIGSPYFSVCVDRLDRYSQASQLRDRVKADNTEEVYVHRRRLPRKR